MSFQVPDVFHAASGEVVEDKHLIAALDQRVRQMRSNESCAARYEVSHDRIS
jgi:hypothetical protein